MNFPDNLKYTNDHEWIRVEGDAGWVGITDYAQGELGDVVFVELPAVGTKVAQGKSFGTSKPLRQSRIFLHPYRVKCLTSTKMS